MRSLDQLYIEAIEAAEQAMPAAPIPASSPARRPGTALVLGAPSPAGVVRSVEQAYAFVIEHPGALARRAWAPLVLLVLTRLVENGWLRLLGGALALAALAAPWHAVALGEAPTTSSWRPRLGAGERKHIALTAFHGVIAAFSAVALALMCQALSIPDAAGILGSLSVGVTLAIALQIMIVPVAVGRAPVYVSAAGPVCRHLHVAIPVILGALVPMSVVGWIIAPDRPAVSWTDLVRAGVSSAALLLATAVASTAASHLYMRVAK